jgi:hypothetical protein
MSSGDAVSGGVVGSISFVKRAAVLRVKYLVAEIAGLGGRRLTPDLVAPHPLNRNGVRLNGHRCEELFMQVFGKYDPREASHGAVCVQAAPGDSFFLDFHRCAGGDEKIAALTSEHLPYASLGSSHINQVLRNIIGQAVVSGCPQATNGEQRLNLALVEAHDFALAEACRLGLVWEVLSYKLAQEEPDGIVCIQAALNDPANAMMLVHEMQIINQMSQVCILERDKAGEVSVQTVRDRLRREGSALADSAAFLPLLQFVLEQGAGGKNAFVDPLVAFHQLFVNPRSRRLRESHFRVVCQLKFPRLRLVLLKAAYGCPVGCVRDGWIDYFGVTHVAKLCSKQADVLDLADELCNRFHIQYAEAGVWLKDVGLRPLHVFDIELGRILLAKEGYSGTIEEVHEVAGKFDARVRLNCLADVLKKLPEVLPLICAGGKKAVVAEALNPTVITFDAEGLATSSHRAHACDVPTMITVNWEHIVDQKEAKALANKCRVLLSLSLAAGHAPLPTMEMLKVGLVAKIPVVQASCAFPKGSLVLLPFVPSHAHIVTECVHPHRVPVTVDTSVLYLLPCWKVSWTNPFWAVRRSQDESVCNCALAEIKDSVIHSVSSGTAFKVSDSRMVVSEIVPVPCLVNTKDISASEEVVLYAPPLMMLRPKAKGQKRQRTWVDDVQSKRIPSDH